MTIALLDPPTLPLTPPADPETAQETSAATATAHKHPWLLGELLKPNVPLDAWPAALCPHREMLQALDADRHRLTRHDGALSRANDYLHLLEQARAILAHLAAFDPAPRRCRACGEDEDKDHYFKAVDICRKCEMDGQRAAESAGAGREAA